MNIVFVKCVDLFQVLQAVILFEQSFHLRKSHFIWILGSCRHFSTLLVDKQSFVLAKDLLTILVVVMMVMIVAGTLSHCDGGTSSKAHIAQDFLAT